MELSQARTGAICSFLLLDIASSLQFSTINRSASPISDATRHPKIV